MPKSFFLCVYVSESLFRAGRQIPMLSIVTPFYFDVTPSSGSLYPSAKTASVVERIASYLDCALCMFWSARTHYPEARLIFIVNDASMINKEYRSLFQDMNIQIVGLEAMSVPSAAIRFKGAFFKLDAISYIANSGSDFNIMLDNDVIFTKRDQALDFFIERRTSLAYSISRPGSKFESKAYLHNLFVTISGEDAPINCEWVGGEFVAGRCDFFREIDCEIKKSINNYWKIYATLHHIGDEVLLSCAVSNVAARGGENVVLNPHVIYRYWTRGVIGYGQLHYRALMQIPILHLPDQKLHGFRSLAKIIKGQPDVKIDCNKLARLLGFSPWSKEVLYRNPIAMLRRTLSTSIRSAMRPVS
jgi:hypothetical protein